MTFVISGRKFDLTDKVKERVQKKLSKLDKYFQSDAQTNVTLSSEKDRQKIEVTIFSNSMIVRAQEESDDMFASLDKVLDTLERQIRKNKTKLEKRLRSGAFDEFMPEYDKVEEEEYKVIKTKRFSVKPMNTEEAILQMSLLGHTFYVYKDADTLLTSVVYKRHDGHYGLIEIE